MKARLALWLPLALALPVVPGRSAEVDPDLTYAEQTLREARQGSDGAALLDFFRRRTVPAADRAKLVALVRQLGDDEFEVRQKASAQLRRTGRPVLPLLRRAATDPDPEIARRAQRLVAALDQASDLAVVEAAARVLAHRKPAGAAKVLLAYLPQADEEGLLDTLLETLAAVGLVGGKADPALVAALTAKEPLLRGAAAFALAGLAAQRPAVRRLLADKDDAVRLRAARALFGAADKAAVPALIALVGRGPEGAAGEAEELLVRLTGDKDPPAVLEVTDPASRRKCAAAWEKWWKENGGKIDLAKVNRDNPTRGLTLASVTTGGGKDGGGRVWVFGRDGKVRWEINAGLQGTAETRLLPNGHVLIAEYRGMRVTERDRRGKIVWEKRLGASAISCQRLANGNTFLASLNELLEVTRQGKTVYSYRITGNLYYACKLRNRHILYVHSGGNLVELDDKGKQVRSIAVGGTSGWGGVSVLPNGNYLVAQYTSNQVVEINKAGKVLWKCSVQTPALATRLGNGNILVASSDGNKLVEINRAGKEVWKQAVQGRPFCIRRY
jgi:hypothetical protein